MLRPQCTAGLQLLRSRASKEHTALLFTESTCSCKSALRLQQVPPDQPGSAGAVAVATM